MTDARFTDAMALGDARAALRELVADGHECPCCRQYAKVYPRPLTSVAVRALIALYRDHRRTFAHLPTIARERLPDVAHQGGYLVLAAHWGLMEDERSVRGEHGRAGYWRVTDLGERFLLARTQVPKYARLYAGRCLGLTGDPVGVIDALGQHFDFDELMGPPPPPDGGQPAAVAQLFDLPPASSSPTRAAA